MTMSRIASVGTANPSFSIEQKLGCELMKKHYSDILRPRSVEVLEKIMEHPSIRKRHIAVDGILELISFKNETQEKRIERFTRWGTRLSCDAIRQAIDSAGVGLEEIRVLVVNTCTGYVCPGLTSYIIEELGLSKNVKAFDLVGLGCGGAVPNIDLAQSVLGAQSNGVAVSVAVEICSATYQMGNDMSLIVSNAIFGDGAAAAVIWNRDSGVELVTARSLIDPVHRDDVRYVYKNGHLHNRLSPHLPEIIGETVPGEIQRICEENGLTPADIRHWAIHPGGHKMLEQIKSVLGLDEEAMTHSRNVLKEFGNMSSPSLLFAFKDVLAREIKPGDWCILVGYGAGLSVYTYLLRA